MGPPVNCSAFDYICMYQCVKNLEVEILMKAASWSGVSIVAVKKNVNDNFDSTGYSVGRQCFGRELHG